MNHLDHILASATGANVEEERRVRPKNREIECSVAIIGMAKF